MNKKYTSLVIEWIVLVVCVSLLLALALPIHEESVYQAKMREADASLTSIRTQLQNYYTKHGEYPSSIKADFVIKQNWNEIQGSDLAGKYFKGSAYRYWSGGGSSFNLSCGAGLVLSSDRTLNQSGNLAGGI
ncbi:MAG: hypothetical protein HQ508_04260 [Candidatus Marinimicrobia bacterium]|nr:hypothetical protein [Candidatus Neomarinimicrobiota bacterium]